MTDIDTSSDEPVELAPIRTAPAQRLLGRRGAQISPADAQAAADIAWRKQQDQAETGEWAEGDDPTDPGEFDPAKHTIDEVLAYVLEHPETKETIAGLERDGKARSTLLAHLDA